MFLQLCGCRKVCCSLLEPERSSSSSLAAADFSQRLRWMRSCSLLRDSGGSAETTFLRSTHYCFPLSFYKVLFHQKVKEMGGAAFAAAACFCESCREAVEFLFSGALSKESLKASLKCLQESQTFFSPRERDLLKGSCRLC